MQLKLTIAIIILFLSTSFSQKGQFFDAPFGGGIGYVPAWYLPNLVPLNSQLKVSGMSELSTSGFYSSGIAGFIYIGFIKHLRIGGMGFGGSLSSSEKDDLVNREIVYSLGGGGVTVEYTLPFIKNIGVSVGAVIGAGNMEIHIYRNSGSFEWENIWEEFGSTQTENYNRKLENSFWMFTPTVNVDFPVYRFVSLRIGAGYQLTFNEDWTADNDQSLSGVPSNLNANTFFIQSGLFIGFFSY
jgi:hypothetical protein